MNGFQEVRLFVTATDAQPAVGSNTFTNVLPQLLDDDGPDTGTDVTPGEVYSYLHRSAVVSGLDPGTYYFWVEAIDTVGNSSGVHRVGSHAVLHVRHSLDTNLLDHGNNLVAEGDAIKFNGSNSYARFADIGEEGVNYGEYVRTGTWSMTFWIKPLVEPSQEMRFLVLRQNNVGITHLTNRGLLSLALTQTPFDLTKDTWHFFAFSVDDHHWTMHKSINGLALDAAYVGQWNVSSLTSNRMFLGANNGGDTRPDTNAFWWDGYARKVTIDNRALTGEEVTTIYNTTKPPS
jgi:hypothetical protein